MVKTVIFQRANGIPFYVCSLDNPISSEGLLETFGVQGSVSVDECGCAIITVYSFA